MSDRAELHDVVAAFRLGARGYILTSDDPRLAIDALRIVLAGSMYFPADILVGRRASDFPAVPPSTSGTEPENSALTDGLEPEQVEVLRLLAEGGSNKLISQRLGIEEASVKMHVRQVLRRLGVTNRTQAALLAERGGLRAPRTADAD